MKSKTKDNFNRQTNRIQLIDIAKGIGILCVIAGHMGIEKIENLVFAFHMPLFFLISGYFMSTTKTFSVYAKEKVKSLLTPYVFTSICLCILALIRAVLLENNFVASVIKDWGVAALYGCGSNNCKLPLGIKSIGAIWFLLALLWALLLVKYLSRFRYAAIYLIVIALLSYISAQYIWLPFSIQAGGVASCFVYVGYLAKRLSLLEKTFNKIILLIGAIVWCIEFMQQEIALSMVRCYYSKGVVSMIGALLICYLVLFISKGLSNTKLGNVFSFYGRYSLVILCFHLIESDMAPWGKVSELIVSLGLNSYIAVCIIFLLKVLFGTSCVLISLKISCIGKLFGISAKKEKIT